MNNKEQIITNCPNCGAPMGGYKCEYCDTSLHAGWTEDRLKMLQEEKINYYKYQIEELKKEIQQANYQAYNTYMLSAITKYLQYPLGGLNGIYY